MQAFTEKLQSKFLEKLPVTVAVRILQVMAGRAPINLMMRVLPRLALDWLMSMEPRSSHHMLRLATSDEILSLIQVLLSMPCRRWI